MTASADILDLICCSGLTRTYGSGAGAVHALRGVSCTLRAGMLVALTGPSGSGKSTLLHLMAGLDTPTGGAISWPGLTASPAAQPGLIGLVFQGPSLLAPLDVAENVALPLLLAGCPEAQAGLRAAAALHDVGLDELAKRLPEELSGGQAQRVAVARALATRPTVILADEPTGQLNSAHAHQVTDLLLQTATRLGAALVLSTHDPAIAGRLPMNWQMTGGHLAAEGGLSC
jgi:putative ABC transport system ATP-binding protein